MKPLYNPYMPGVHTVIQQYLDLTRMDERHFKELYNTAVSGLVVGRGYKSTLLRAISDYCCITSPAWMWRHNGAYLAGTRFLSEADIEEIIAVSNARAALNSSRRNRVERSDQNVFKGYMCIYGWHNDAGALKKELVWRMEKNEEFVHMRMCLAKVVLSKPRIKLYDSER